MIYNYVCFSCRPQMMHPSGSRLFFGLCCILDAFYVRTICIVECPGKKGSWGQVGVLHSRVFFWIVVVSDFFPFYWFFCLHDLWGIDYGPTGQVSGWRHRTSNRLGLVHRSTNFRKIKWIRYCAILSFQSFFSGWSEWPHGYVDWEGWQSRWVGTKSTLSICLFVYLAKIYKFILLIMFSKVRRLENGVTWLFFIESCMFCLWLLHMQFLFFSLRLLACIKSCIKDAHQIKRNVRRRFAKMKSKILDQLQSKLLSDEEDSQ